MASKVKAKRAPKKSPIARRGRATTSRISSKNQITIPVEVLREVKMNPGDQVEFMIDKENRIVITTAQDADWKRSLRALAGSMPGFGRASDYQKGREEWDRKSTPTLRG
ncbi:MAG: hypothetical protein RLZZ478_131 [Actinomycetota bacterium]|jgi:AbrB family looped-hinge helix DNA binding protein